MSKREYNQLVSCKRPFKKFNLVKDSKLAKFLSILIFKVKTKCQIILEFDPSSERTLAARLTHASRTEVLFGVL